MFETASRRAAAVVVLWAFLPAPAASQGQLTAEDAAAVRPNLEFVGVDPIDAEEEFFGRFTEDVDWNYRGLRARGMEALREAEWCHTNSGEHAVEHLEGSGGLAWVRGTYRLSLDCGDADPVEAEGEFVTVHRRDRDGVWRIALYVALD